ncbi:aldehyde dehydrogenase family protein [Mesorhizobium sp. M0189]|uniref:aldehyde dehydrogenase family protein n=1 Tax=Mesorhizobium sp. M0189 TaxID=2956909 RepID=UPI00333D9512
MFGETSYELFINGMWRAASDGKKLPLINPATEQVFGQVASASVSDLDEALASAECAREAWAALPAGDRGAILVKAAGILKDKIDAAAKSLSREQGKTIAEAKGEYERAVETLEWNGQLAENLSKPIPMGPGRMIVPEGIGVVAAFTPWNYPAVLNARKLAAPLAAGCPVILKGAEETPSAAVFLVQSLQEAGIPVGVVNLVFGVPAQISEHLLASTVVKVLTFTGSTGVGKQLAKLAANNLQRCVLELGGHSPVIVCEDADLAKTIPLIAEYKFECAGQSCNAPSRVLVARPLYNEFVARMTETVSKIRIGAPEDPSTEMGPMANARRVEAMERLTKDAVDRGAHVEIGGSRLDRPGFFWPPTILTDVPADSKVLKEEPFGPILTVESFDTLEEAILRANTTEYGLASYFFTSSPDITLRLVSALAAGAVSVNYLKGVSADAPNGGINQSGYGYEGGELGLRSFQNLKLINGMGSFG